MLRSPSCAPNNIHVCGGGGEASVYYFRIGREGGREAPSEFLTFRTAITRLRTRRSGGGGGGSGVKPSGVESGNQPSGMKTDRIRRTDEMK